LKFINLFQWALTLNAVKISNQIKMDLVYRIWNSIQIFLNYLIFRQIIMIEKNSWYFEWVQKLHFPYWNSSSLSSSFKLANQKILNIVSLKFTFWSPNLICLLAFLETLILQRKIRRSCCRRLSISGKPWNGKNKL